MVTPAAKREAAAHLCDVHGVSQRRACRAIGVERTSIRYRSRRPDDGAVRSRLRELAAVRRRFGWRRLHVLLSREGVHLNHKKLRRLYIEERLQVRRRGGRKRALGTRAPMVLPQGPNQRWSLDFVSDTLTDGRRFRILAMVDDRLAAELMSQARAHGMDALVEVHNDEEMARASALGADLVGVNNRNLRTFETDLSITERLAAAAPDGALLVTESGIFTSTEAARLERSGATAMLVGESLMRQPDVTAATRLLLG